MDNEFSYGKGRISLAELDPNTGARGKWRYIGDVSAAGIKLSTEKVQHVESNTGQNGLAASFQIKKAAALDLTLHELNADNLALVTNGGTNTVAAGSATAEALDSDLVAGDYVYTLNQGISALVITDSAGTPATLVEGTDYELSDADFGRIKILNVGTYVQPFKAAYSYRARSEVGMFTAGQKHYALRYEGINLAYNNRPEVVDLYKIAPDVIQELSLIASGNDVAGAQVSSDILLDSSKSAAGALGQYGNIKHVAVA